MSKKIMAIVGNYRKGGTIDTTVNAVLEGARRQGAETETIYLAERHIEFCRNCRECMQHPGEERGECVQRDDLDLILEKIDAADGLVLGAPVNCFNVTAIFRRFMERLVGAACWPWGQNAPRPRSKRLPRKAVLVSSSAMPGFLIPIATGAPRALRLTASMLGARPVAHLWVGLAAGAPQAKPSPRTLEHARRAGRKIAA
jgi:NAD(P)H-dependent FMN reductase